MHPPRSGKFIRNSCHLVARREVHPVLAGFPAAARQSMIRPIATAIVKSAWLSMPCVFTGKRNIRRWPRNRQGTQRKGPRKPRNKLRRRHLCNKVFHPPPFLPPPPFLSRP